MRTRRKNHSSLRLRVHRLLLIGVLLTGSVIGGASESLPDSEENRVTGKIEIVDTGLLDGRRQVRHAEDSGQGEAESPVWLSGQATDDDYEPRISLDDNGNSFIVWWRDSAIPQVLFSQRLGQGEFSAPEIVSETSESSGRPEIVTLQDEIWISYEIDLAEARGIAVTNRISEIPEPFPSRTVIHTTEFGGSLDTRIHASRDKVWITWIDSEIEVGWSEYDREAAQWSSPRFQNYEEDSVDSARALIREQVLGN